NCNSPQWRHSVSLENAIQFPFQFGYSYLSGDDLITTSYNDHDQLGVSYARNHFGDHVFGNRNYLSDYTITGSNVLGLFLTRYQRSSNQWSFSSSLSYQNPYNLLIPHYSASETLDGSLQSTITTSGVFTKMHLSDQ